MNFVDALVYPYRERNWLPKLGFAVIAALVPVAGLFLLKGWELETSARVFRGERPYLASWGRPHTHLFDGLKVAAAEFIYNIPGMILALYALFGGVIFFIGFFNQPDRTLLHFLELYLETLPRRLIMLGIALLLNLIASAVYWAGYVRYIQTRQFRTFFDIVPNMVIVFRTIWDDLIMFVYMWLFKALLFVFGSLLTGLFSVTGIGAAAAIVVVPPLGVALTQAFQGYLYGQLAINAFREMQPASPAPAEVGNVPLDAA